MAPEGVARCLRLASSSRVHVQACDGAETPCRSAGLCVLCSRLPVTFCSYRGPSGTVETLSQE